MLDNSGKVATNLGGARVLFDGMPAPLLYASVSQVNAIVPYEVSGKDATPIDLEYQGVRAQAWGVPVVPAAPCGSVVQIYGAGEGLTLPPGVTGSITHLDLKTPRLRVTVTIGGIEAKVEYAGSAPELVAGVIQVNAIVPSNTVTGPSVPIILKVGNARSPDGVTIGVR